MISRRLNESPVHVTLIDPDKQPPGRAAEMAVQAEDGGTHILLIGGTTGVDAQKLGATLCAVKEVSDLPMVIFPASSTSISCHADAIFFMSLLNSRDVRYVVREAARASLELSRSGMEIIPVGYLVFEPGMLVGRIGDVDLIARDDIRTAQEYAKATELFGMGFCYLEGGSGVSEPIPSGMISAVREVIDIPIILGGGISDAAKAEEAVRAGADIIVTGTMVERETDIEGAVRDTVSGMVRGWKDRRTN
jgi:phosphoglycerol geranylgeranyltransferase